MTAWITLVTLVVQLLPLRPLAAQEALGDSDSFNFAEATPTTVSSSVDLGQGNAMKVREAPVSVTGAFETTLPIDLPPGRLGMTPALALAYSSDAFRSDSPVGAGFNLNVPSISRSTSSGFPPVVSPVPGERRYADDLSGNSLLAGRVLFTSPSGDLVPADTAAPPASAGALFLPQREQAPVRYEFIAAEDRWIEHLPNGRKRFYGASAAGAAPARVVNELGTHRWLLVEERDADENHVDYAYHHIEEQLRADLFSVQPLPVLREVRWGGNDAAGIAPQFRATTSIAPYPDGPVDMLDGHVVLTSKITTLAIFGPSASGAEEPYWSYALLLEPSVDSRRQLLRSVSRIAADGSEPLVFRFDYSGNQGQVAFEPPVPAPGALAGLYVSNAELNGVDALQRFVASNATLTPLARPQGFQFLDHDADGDLDILYHPAGLKTPAAKIVGAASFSAEAAGNGQVPAFEPFGLDFGYAPDLLVKNLADLDGDRDLDAVSFRMDIQHDRAGEQTVISRGVFEEPEDVTAGLLCSARGAGDSQDVGAVGFGGSRVGRVACPDPLPPDLQIQPPDLPFDFPEIFPDVGDPLNPFVDIINPPDPLGSAPVLDFTRRSVQFGDVEVLLSTSYPSGSFFDANPDDIVRLIEAQAIGPRLPTVTLTIPTELDPSRVLLGTTGSLRINDRVTLVGSAGQLACVTNSGSAESNFGVGTRIGEVWTRAQLTLRGSIVDGPLRASGGISQQLGTVINGPVNTAAFSSATTSLEFAFRAPQGDIEVPNDTAQTLPPGSYGDLVVRARSELHLDGGQYDFDTLLVEPQARVIFHQAAPTALFARTGFTFRGSFLRDGAGEPDVLVVSPSTSDVHVEAPFTGTLIAPNAKINLATVRGGEHVGAFFARDIEAHQDSIVRHRAFPLAGLENARALPVDFRFDRVEDLVVRAPQLRLGTELGFIDAQLDSGFVQIANARLQVARSKNPIPASRFDFADTALLTPDTGLVADVIGRRISIDQEDLDNAKSFLCNDLCNGGDGFFACIESLGGFGNAWLQSDASVTSFGDTPTLSDPALIGTVGHFVGAPVDIGVDFGAVATGAFPDVCSAPPISMACVGMMLLCDDPTKCDDVSVGVPSTSVPIAISEYSKERVEQNPTGNPALSSLIQDDVLVLGWPRIARQVVSLRKECGPDVNLRAQPESDFQAPFVDVDADGRADIVLLKSLRRVGDDFTFLSIGQAFINRLKENRTFIIDRADTGSSTAFSESLTNLLAPNTQDFLACIPGHTSFSGNNDECDQNLTFPLGLDFMTLPVDLNGDGLSDMVIARPPEGIGGQKACLSGNVFHVNRGYGWEPRVQALDGSTLPGFFTPRLAGPPGPLELLRNRGRACGAIGSNLIETSLETEIPPEAMRLADLNADGRTDIVFAHRRSGAGPERVLFRNTGRDFVAEPVPEGVGDFAVTTTTFGPVLAGDVQRLVDLDNDGLTDVLQAGICELGGCQQATFRRNSGVVPDLLTSVVENTGSSTSVEYVAATSAPAQSSGVVRNAGQLPAGKMVASRVSRAPGPANAAWTGFGPNAVEDIHFVYENFVREQGSSKALGFERVTALFDNSLPGGVPLERVETTRVFDARASVALENGAPSPVLHPLRGTLRELVTTSGATRSRQLREYFLSALVAGSVLVRPNLETRELCEAGTCVTTARASRDFDAFGFAARVEAGNFDGAAVVADDDRVEVVRTYEHRQDLWKLGLRTSETLLGFSENISGIGNLGAALSVERTSYDELGRPELVTRALSDAAGPCAAFPTESTRAITYTAFGLPALVTEQGIRSLVTTYDATGLYPAQQSINVVGAGGAPGVTLSETFAFDFRFGELISRTDHNAQTFSRTLDGRRRPLQVSGPGGVLLEQSTYRDATATTPNSITTVKQIDPGLSYSTVSFGDGEEHGLAQVELVPGRSSPFVRRQRAIFDAFGRRVESAQPRPALGFGDVAIAGDAVDRFAHDGFDRLTLAQQAGREPLLIAYAVNAGAEPGSVISRQNPRGTLTTSLLNARGRVVTVSAEAATGADLGTTRLVRDGADRVLRVLDADGLERNLSYDLGGRSVEATLPHQPGAGTVASLSCHDADGRLVAHTTATGRQTLITRDNLGRELQVAQSFEGELRTHTLQYDSPVGKGLGRLVASSDDGGSYRFEYDEFGRVTLTEYTLSPLLAGNVPPPAGPTLVILDDFTLRGQLDRRETNGLGVAPLVIELALDAKGAVTAVEALDAAFPTGRPLVTSVTYDAFDRPTSIELGNGSSILRTYDPATQRPSAIQHSDGDPFAELLFTAYDDNDNLLREERRAEGEPIVVKTHAYDSLDRLASSSVDLTTASEQQSFAYSLGGNLLSAPTGAYAYDLGDNAQAVTQITGDAFERTLVYDGDGQLRSDVTSDDRSGQTRVLRRELLPDANGCLERVEAEETLDGALTASIVTRHVCNAAGERVARDTLDQLTNERERVMFLPGGHELRPDEPAGSLLLQRVQLSEIALAELAWSTDTGEPIATESGYLHTDLRGSVLAKTALDDPVPTFLERADYTAFGASIAFGGEALPTRQFTGAEPDPLTADYRLGLRTYDAHLARFFSPDPAAWNDPGAFEHDPQQLNLYAYARNNPVTARDRQGDVAETLWDIANIAIGVVSLVDNIKQGNVVAAVIDGAGVLVDTAAAVVPFVPGGAGAAIKGARGGAAAVEMALETVTAGDRAIDAARGANIGRVGLDTNAIIARLEGSSADVQAVVQAMANRNPVVSITAVKEFLRGGGDVAALRDFLTEAGGAVGRVPSQKILQDLTSAGLKPADARVVGSAVEEGISVLTRDKDILKKVPEVAEKF